MAECLDCHRNSYTGRRSQRVDIDLVWICSACRREHGAVVFTGAQRYVWAGVFLITALGMCLTIALCVLFG
jgi:hypothetical protein